MLQIENKRHFGRVWSVPFALLALAVSGPAMAQESLVTPALVGRPDAPMTIIMAPRFGYSHQSNDAQRHKVLTEAFDSWAYRHPQAKIDVQVQQGEDAVIIARLIQNAQSGRAPDAMMIEQPFYQTFYGLAESFDPYLSSADKADFLPGTLNGMQDPDTGEVKFLQITAYTYGLWYRSDLIDTPPTSLEEMADMAEQLVAEHDFKYGLFVLGGEEIAKLTLLSHVASLGGEVMADDADSTPVFGEGENREILIRVLSWYKDQVDRGILPAEVVSFSRAGDVVSRVAAGDMPFVLEGSYTAGGISQTPDGDKWAFAPMPQLEGADPVTYQSGWAWAMFTEDAEKQALITDMLMDTYIGPWAMARFGEAGGYTPTRTSALENYAAFVTDPLETSIAEAVSQAVPLPNGRYFQLVTTALATAFQKVVTGSATAEQAVDEAWATVQLEM